MGIEQSKLSEEEIISRVLAGRAELYEMLVRKYWRLAVTAALGRGHDQWGIVLNKEWVKERLKTPFAREMLKK